MKHKFRICVALLSMTGLFFATGCSWLPIGGETGSDNEENASGAGWNDGGDVPPMPESTGDDASGQLVRPGETVDFPEMKVIYFDYNRFNIRADQREILVQNLKRLNDNPQDKVYIEGHCDERGTIEYNFNLGQRRANVIRDYFIENGVNADRIATVSKGEEEPSVTGHTEAAWSQNRRCEFRRMY